MYFLQARAAVEAVTLTRSTELSSWLQDARFVQADLLAIRGDFDGAQRLHEEGKGITDKMGNPELIAAQDLVLAD
jgi:hypothetical protein